jgi:hypothetical protein
MTVYTGADHQPVQTGVVNQMGTALPGDLAFPNDNNLLDMCPMGESAGIVCGRIVSLRPVSSLWATGLTPPQRAGISNYGIMSLTHGETDTDDGTVADAVGDIAGVLIRSNSVRTNSDGLPQVNYNEIGTVLRKGANGRRVWVDCGAVSNMAVGNTAYVISVTTATASLYEVGTICNTNYSTDSAAAIDISTIAKVVAPSVLAYTTAAGVAHYMCMIEFI